MGYTYRFPTLEIIVALFAFVAFSSVLSTSFMNEIVVSPSFDNGSNVLQQLESFLTMRTNGLIVSIFYPYIHVIAFVAPIVVALSLANSFEDRTIQTLLTYPIRRSVLLSSKLFYATILLGAIANILSLCAAFLYLPEIYSNMSLMIMLLISIWITIFMAVSISALISLLSKRIAVAAVGGVGFWYSVQLLANSGTLPTFVSQILNPLGTTISFISSTDFTKTVSYADLSTPLFGAFGIGASVLIVAFIMFMKMDV
jgi:ABC-type transport system involved in multi-copper enzyme maturation permease subunit